ncbi:hypothetical protein WJX82_006690 [Trebouxia sp. C0006]
METLLAHGADASAQDNQGLTAMHCAAQGGNVEMVQALLSSGADVHAKDCLGWTALHCAVYNCSEAMANMLLVAGAVVNLQDNEGCTPLHLYPSIKNQQGETPADPEVLSRHPELANAVKAHTG